MCFYCCISRLHTYLCMCFHSFPSGFPSSLSSWSQVTAHNLSFSVVGESSITCFSRSEEKIEWLQLLYRCESPNINSSHLVPESFFLHCLKYLGWKDKSGWDGRGIRMGWISPWTGRVDAALSYRRLRFGSQLWSGQAEPSAWLFCKPAECWLLAYMIMLSTN